MQKLPQIQQSDLIDRYIGNWKSARSIARRSGGSIRPSEMRRMTREMEVYARGICSCDAKRSHEGYVKKCNCQDNINNPNNKTSTFESRISRSVNKRVKGKNFIITT